MPASLPIVMAHTSRVVAVVVANDLLTMWLVIGWFFPSASVSLAITVSFAVGHCFPSVTVVLCPVGCVDDYKCCCIAVCSGVGVKP